jgi:hypothetical protein
MNTKLLGWDNLLGCDVVTSSLFSLSLSTFCFLALLFFSLCCLVALLLFRWLYFLLSFFLAVFLPRCLSSSLSF